MTNPIPFEHVIVDADTPPDPHIKAMGDVGGNGLADIVIPYRRYTPRGRGYLQGRARCDPTMAAVYHYD